MNRNISLILVLLVPIVLIPYIFFMGINLYIVTMFELFCDSSCATSGVWLFLYAIADLSFLFSVIGLINCVRYNFTFFKVQKDSLHRAPVTFFVMNTASLIILFVPVCYAIVVQRNIDEDIFFPIMVLVFALLNGVMLVSSRQFKSWLRKTSSIPR